MREKASGRWIDAEGKIDTPHLEPQILHLRCWQNILLDREGNEALMCIFLADWERKLKDHCWTMAIFLLMLILGRCSYRLIFNPWKTSSLGENSSRPGRET